MTGVPWAPAVGVVSNLALLASLEPVSVVLGPVSVLVGAVLWIARRTSPRTGVGPS